jgi:hypothetical protein
MATLSMGASSSDGAQCTLRVVKHGWLLPLATMLSSRNVRSCNLQLVGGVVEFVILR